MVSKTQIDRLGDRLREGNINEDDLRLLNEYRLSFSEAYNFVVGAIRNELKLEPTGRPAKSTTSISEKLTRESIRLSQMQDIAGCRLVVSNILKQNSVIESVLKLFRRPGIVDRRAKPSHSYRAVHVIVQIEGKPVEVQIRTSLQHVWAELSEKLSDVVDPKIKYGGGDESFVQLLASASELVAEVEDEELDDERIKARLARLMAGESVDAETQRTLITLQQEMRDIENRGRNLRERVFQRLRNSVDSLPKNAPKR